MADIDLTPVPLVRSATDAERHKAAIRVAEWAYDMDDLRDLLSVLGLIEAAPSRDFSATYEKNTRMILQSPALGLPEPGGSQEFDGNFVTDPGPLAQRVILRVLRGRTVRGRDG